MSCQIAAAMANSHPGMQVDAWAGAAAEVFEVELAIEGAVGRLIRWRIRPIDPGRRSSSPRSGGPGARRPWWCMAGELIGQYARAHTPRFGSASKYLFGDREGCKPGILCPVLARQCQGQQLAAGPSAQCSGTHELVSLPVCYCQVPRPGTGMKPCDELPPGSADAGDPHLPTGNRRRLAGRRPRT